MIKKAPVAKTPRPIPIAKPIGFTNANVVAADVPAPPEAIAPTATVSNANAPVRPPAASKVGHKMSEISSPTARSKLD